MYDIDAQGHTTIAPYIATLAEPNYGETTSNRHPNQVSLVCTWMAGGLGRGRRGRIYLPPQGLAVDTDDQIGVEVAGDIAFLMQQFIGNVNAEMSGDAIAVIASGAGAGILRGIDTIKIGRVLDTQRRRRRSVPEEYVIEAVA
jgi:hypothetical protein